MADTSPAVVLLGLHREARQAPDLETLRFVIVNRSRSLIAYRQAVLVEGDGAGWRIAAVSNIARLDANAPYMVWARATMKSLAGSGLLAKAGAIAPDTLPQRLAGEWAQWWPPDVWWQPLTGVPKERPAGLILLRDDLPGTEERAILDDLADGYGHALAAQAGFRGRAGVTPWRRRLVAVAGVAAGAAVLAFPVPMTAVAPAFVVAHDPVVIASPINGVIAEVVVAPNAPVKQGELLFRFEKAELAAGLEVARRTLALAEADLLRARQQAFGDPRSNAEAALKQAVVALRRTEQEYAAYLLAQADVRAEADGIAVFASAADWRGRPVQVGERVMSLADPARVRVEAHVPASDAGILENGAGMTFILDGDPLHPLRGRVEYASYAPELAADGVLSYRVDALLDDGTIPRIGLRGVARIEGGRVPLAVLLFRRPIAAVRQWAGL